MNDKSTLLLNFLKDNNITQKEAIDMLNRYDEIQEVNEAKDFLELSLVGYLTKAFGLNGYNTAQLGHPVYEKKDRYVIFLAKDGGPSYEVSFYKETLIPYISFFQTT